MSEGLQCPSLKGPERDVLTHAQDDLRQRRNAKARHELDDILNDDATQVAISLHRHRLPQTTGGMLTLEREGWV
jgi:hypothetical protein